MPWEIKTGELVAIQKRFEQAPRTLADYIEKNLRTLTKIIIAKERRVLEPVKYRGNLARSLSAEFDFSPPTYRVVISPTAPEADIVLTGTKPHWAPIGPLLEWARWKLGDEKAAYPVQKLIAHQGTSTWIERKGLGDGHGGYNYPQRTLDRGDVKLAIERTSQRIPLDLKLYLEQGKQSVAGATE